MQGQSASHSECTVLTVTISVTSDPHRLVTDVTYDTGQSAQHSTVLAQRQKDFILYFL
jgi:hypothetical protein